jgi:hypothetical protein
MCLEAGASVHPVQPANLIATSPPRSRRESRRRREPTGRRRGLLQSRQPPPTQSQAAFAPLESALPRSTQRHQLRPGERRRSPQRPERPGREQGLALRTPRPRTGLIGVPRPPMTRIVIHEARILEWEEPSSHASALPCASTQRPPWSYSGSADRGSSERVLGVGHGGAACEPYLE